MERKTLSLEIAEFKFATDGRTFEGYASVFNGVDSYGDTILPGAYAETIRNRQRPIQMRWNHSGPIIGKWLEVEEDGKGLRVKGELTPGHSVAEDVKALMSHGAVNGLSIGFRIPPGGSEKDGRLRKLKKIDLVEISVVEEPADLSARVASIKSAIDEAMSLKEIEDCLRDACGLSRSDATALVARVKSIAHGEREAESKAQADSLRAMFDKF